VVTLIIKCAWSQIIILPLVTSSRCSGFKCCFSYVVFHEYSHGKKLFLRWNFSPCNCSFSLLKFTAPPCLFLGSCCKPDHLNHRIIKRIWIENSLSEGENVLNHSHQNSTAHNFSRRMQDRSFQLKSFFMFVVGFFSKFHLLVYTTVLISFTINPTFIQHSSLQTTAGPCYFYKLARRVGRLSSGKFCSMQPFISKQKSKQILSWAPDILFGRQESWAVAIVPKAHFLSKVNYMRPCSLSLETQATVIYRGTAV